MRPGRPAARWAAAVRLTAWSRSPPSWTSRLQVSRVLQHAPSEGLLLFVDLERGKSNMGLASLRIGQLAPTVLA